jgi:hypothetical protein
VGIFDSSAQRELKDAIKALKSEIADTTTSVTKRSA